MKNEEKMFKINDTVYFVQQSNPDYHMLISDMFVQEAKVNFIVENHITIELPTGEFENFYSNQIFRTKQEAYNEFLKSIDLELEDFKKTVLELQLKIKYLEETRELAKSNIINSPNNCQQ